MNRREVLGALLALPGVSAAKPLELQARDVIVVKVKGDHPMAAYRQIQGQITDLVGDRFVVFVVSEDVEITTLRALEEAARR